MEKQKNLISLEWDEISADYLSDNHSEENLKEDEINLVREEVQKLFFNDEWLMGEMLIRLNEHTKEAIEKLKQDKRI